MAEIHLCPPGSPYKSMLDTGVTDVVVKKAYIGVCFEADNGSQLSISNRDDGFEILYNGKLVEFKEGIVVFPSNSTERV